MTAVLPDVTLAITKAAQVLGSAAEITTNTGGARGPVVIDCTGSRPRPAVD